MKNIFYSFFFILFLSNIGLAQPYYDAKWVLGLDGLNTPTHKGALFNFLYDTLTISPIILKDIETTDNLASISDSKGNFIAFTNGCAINNKNYELMSNGDKLNPGHTFDGYCPAGLGYPISGGSLFLPNPEDTSKYHLFHIREGYSELLPDPYFDNDLLETTIDKTLDNGLGAVIEKNKMILSDTFRSGGALATVRHANGKDWWLVVAQAKTNGYFKLLFSGKGTVKKDLQKIGNIMPAVDWAGQSAFSPDGKHYASGCVAQPLQVFDFDRCSGQFSNPRSDFPIPSDIGCAGIAFSPNSRFVYISTGLKLFQYDLEASDFAKSKVLIDSATTKIGGTHTISFYTMQLAPDHKIYMASTVGYTGVHVINQPDSLGKKCDFVQVGVKTPTIVWKGLPKFPNYRLGAVAGPPCPAMVDDKELGRSDFYFTLSPNPTQQALWVQLNEVTQANFMLYNQLGQLVYQTQLATISTDIDISSLDPGLYFARIGNTTQKLIIQK